MNKTYLVIGSNKGDRLFNISKSFVFINQKIGETTNQSPLYETEPWGFDSENKFLNIAVEAVTMLEPGEILKRIKDFEKELGRKKKNISYDSREIDIDIIFYNNEIIRKPDLIIPHPKMHKRRFVLEPLIKIIPKYKHPILKKDITKLFLECEDSCAVNIFDD